MTQEQGPTGQRLIAGRYMVLREIGRGGMGVVWLAEDRMIGRRVAIKELHLPEGVPPEERGVFEERVLREARTAGRLNDPGVVTVHDVLQEAGGTYIVMELIEAPTLADQVRRSGPLAQDAVVSLANQLLPALEAAHAAGIVHRDVKPSNVMVLPNGRVKLTDFGIAQSLEDPRLTTSGVLIGSPTYMAPERIRGGEADAASDLWSLGAVLFFAVEGQAPFERQTTAATMHAIMTEVPVLTRCQGPLASVIIGLLINTPQARLTAQQVHGLLAQTTQLTGPTSVLHTPAAGTRVLDPGPPARRTGRRRALTIGVAAIVAAALLAVGWLIGSNLGNEADPGASPETTSPTQTRPAKSGTDSGSSNDARTEGGSGSASPPSAPPPTPTRDPELVAVEEALTRYENAVNTADDDAVKRVICDGSLGDLYPNLDEGQPIHLRDDAKLVSGNRAMASAYVPSKGIDYTIILNKADRWCVAS